MNRMLMCAGAVLLSCSGSVLSDSGGKTLASTMEVYVFPKKGQESAEQSMHEAACYDWATENTGNDPFSLAKKESADAAQAKTDIEQAKKTGQGAGAGGAIRGAMVGAVIGEVIDDDASDGAKYGAAAGLISSRRRAKAARAQATNEAENKSAATKNTTAADLANFKKAFSVCLEAKDYMVKY